MAVEFEDPIDLNKLEIQNVRLQQLDTDPAGAVEGQIWHRNDLHRPRVNDGTVNQELAFLTDAQLVYDAEKDPTGFENNQNITATYNGTNRTVTLTTTDPQLVYYFNGRKKLLGTNTWTSTAHANTAGNWYLYSTDGTNFTWSNTVWQFYHVQVAGIRYVSATKYITLREIHGMAGWEFHRAAHLGIGTQRNSSTPTGGTVGGFVLGSTATADRRPSVTTVDLLDEDLITNVAALVDGGPYSHLQLASSTTTDYVLNTELEIVHMSGTAAQYQSPTTGAWSNIGNNNFANIYVVAVPAMADTISQYGRWLMFQPQAVYANLGLARGESFENLNRADLNAAFAEFLPLSRITIKAVASYFSIEAVDLLYGTRAGASGVPAAAATTASAVSFVPTGGIAATDVQSALIELDTEKANLASPAFTGTVSGITKAMVGLGNVDNTSDANKPVSTAQQTALNAKQNLDANLTSIAALSDTGSGLVRFTSGAASLDTNTYLTGNQTITLSGVVTGSGTTAITTAIADGALSIAKTSGLQTALNGKQNLDANLTSIAALSDSGTGLVRFTAGTASLDTNTYLTSVPAHSNATASVVGIATAGLFGHVRASGTTPLVAGTANIGVDNGYFAREGHVHPAQTTVSGNAGSATVLQTARTINGVSFDGSANITINAVPTNNDFYVQGENSTRSNNTSNLDTVAKSGFYTALPGSTGLPVAGAHHLIATKYTDPVDNWNFQIAAGFGPTAAGNPPEAYHMRIQEGAAWKPWRKLYHDGESLIPSSATIDIGTLSNPFRTTWATESWVTTAGRAGVSERIVMRDWAGSTTGNLYGAIYSPTVTPTTANAAFLCKTDGTTNYLNGTVSSSLSVGDTTNNAVRSRVAATQNGVILYGGLINSNARERFACNDTIVKISAGDANTTRQRVLVEAGGVTMYGGTTTSDATRFQVNNTGIGFFGVPTVARQASSGSGLLPYYSFGVLDSTWTTANRTKIEALSIAVAAISDNIINIKAALQQYGLLT